MKKITFWFWSRKFKYLKKMSNWENSTFWFLVRKFKYLKKMGKLHLLIFSAKTQKWRKKHRRGRNFEVKKRAKKVSKKYLLSSSCEADNGPADLLGSSLNDLGVGGLPSIILLWLSASSRLNSWLGVDKWSCKKAHRSLSRWHKSNF